MHASEGKKLISKNTREANNIKAFVAIIGIDKKQIVLSVYPINTKTVKNAREAAELRRLAIHIKKRY